MQRVVGVPGCVGRDGEGHEGVHLSCAVGFTGWWLVEATPGGLLLVASSGLHGCRGLVAPRELIVVVVIAIVRHRLLLW